MKNAKIMYYWKAIWQFCRRRKSIAGKLYLHRHFRHLECKWETVFLSQRTHLSLQNRRDEGKNVEIVFMINSSKVRAQHACEERRKNERQNVLWTAIGSISPYLLEHMEKEHNLLNNVCVCVCAHCALGSWMRKKEYECHFCYLITYFKYKLSYYKIPRVHLLRVASFLNRCSRFQSKVIGSSKFNGHANKQRPQKIILWN